MLKIKLKDPETNESIDITQQAYAHDQLFYKRLVELVIRSIEVNVVYNGGSDLLLGEHLLIESITTNGLNDSLKAREVQDNFTESIMTNESGLTREQREELSRQVQSYLRDIRRQLTVPVYRIDRERFTLRGC